MTLQSRTIEIGTAPAVGLFAHHSWSGETWYISGQDADSGLYHLTNFSRDLWSRCVGEPWVIFGTK